MFRALAVAVEYTDADQLRVLVAFQDDREAPPRTLTREWVVGATRADVETSCRARLRELRQRARAAAAAVDLDNRVLGTIDERDTP